MDWVKAIIQCEQFNYQIQLNKAFLRAELSSQDKRIGQHGPRAIRVLLDQEWICQRDDSRGGHGREASQDDDGDVRKPWQPQDISSHRWAQVFFWLADDCQIFSNQTTLDSSPKWFKHQDPIL